MFTPYCVVLWLTLNVDTWSSGEKMSVFVIAVSAVVYKLTHSMEDRQDFETSRNPLENDAVKFTTKFKRVRTRKHTHTYLKRMYTRNKNSWLDKKKKTRKICYL